MESTTLLLILSVIGLSIAGYIYYKKNNNQQLVCVIGQNCNEVVNSKYGTTFGIDNTVAGMMYYLFVIMGSSLLMNGVTALFAIPMTIAMFTAGSLGALFSIYLLFIQLKILKEWCEWCIVSAGLTLGIFVVELVFWII